MRLDETRSNENQVSTPTQPSLSQTPGASICAHLQDAPFWCTAASVGAYLAAPRLREVSVDAAVCTALASGSPSLFLPTVTPNVPASMTLLHVDGVTEGLDVVTAPPFGIREPTRRYPRTHARSPDEPRTDALTAGLDVLIVPCAAFDRTGGRLGRGGGYYDCFAHAAATAHPPGPLLVGVAFSYQIVEAVPLEPHDVRVDVLVTADDGCVGVSERGRRAL